MTPNPILFQATIEDFTMVPYVRMTQKNKWRPGPQRYLKSQQDLAWLFKAAYKKSMPIDVPCIISYSVHLPHNRGVDEDNIGKALRDALQYARVIENDKLIRGSNKTILHQKAKGPARVVVSLKALEGE